MDGAHGEDGALELLESGRNLRDEAVLEDEAGFNLAGNDGQELSGARVGVRCVDATGPKEGNCGGDVKTGEDWEGVDVCSLYSAASRLGRVVIEVEDDTLAESVASK